MAICISEGHITSDRGELHSIDCYKSPSKLSDSAEPQSPVCPSSDQSRIGLGKSPRAALHARAPCLCCTSVRRGRCSHNARAERMTEKSAVTPSAMSVQIKEKAPLDLASVPPTPAPFMWMTATTNPMSDMTRIMTYPDRLSASTS